MARAALPTPSLVVDLDVFDANVEAAAAMFAATPGKVLRPHVKAHRTPALALRQQGFATQGITCATVGEAEAMVAAGLDDVLLANEVVAPDKLDRLVGLRDRARIAVAVDSRAGVAALSRAARRRGVEVAVLIDLDLGLLRCGVIGAADAVALARLVDRSPGLTLAGVMGYEGRRRASDPHRGTAVRDAYETLGRARDALFRAGIAVPCVSAAGTSTLREALADPTITEIQAGTYALMEPDLDGLGLPFTPSVEIVACVISRHRGRVVLDVGRKSVACDLGLPVPLVVRATTVATYEEHSILAWQGPLPALGQAVALRPLNARLTFNLHDSVWLVQGGEVVDCVPVSAGRRSQ